MKSKSLLKKIFEIFQKEKSIVPIELKENEIEIKIKNNNLFNNNTIETDVNYFTNLIPNVKEKINLRKQRKKKIYYSTSLATSLSVVLLYFFGFNSTYDLDYLESLTDNEMNAIIINENLMNNESIFTFVGEEFIEQFEEDYSNEIKPEYYEDIKKYNIVFDIKDLDQEMLQAFHDKLINTKILGDL